VTDDIANQTRHVKCVDTVGGTTKDSKSIYKKTPVVFLMLLVQGLIPLVAQTISLQCFWNLFGVHIHCLFYFYKVGSFLDSTFLEGGVERWRGRSRCHCPSQKYEQPLRTTSRSRAETDFLVQQLLA